MWRLSWRLHWFCAYSFCVAALWQWNSVSVLISWVLFNAKILFPQFVIDLLIVFAAADIPKCKKGDSECIIKSSNLVMKSYGKGKFPFQNRLTRFRFHFEWWIFIHKKKNSFVITTAKEAIVTLICFHWIRWIFRSFISNKVKKVPSM